MLVEIQLEHFPVDAVALVNVKLTPNQAVGRYEQSLPRLGRSNTIQKSIPVDVPPGGRHSVCMAIVVLWVTPRREVTTSLLYCFVGMDHPW